MSVSFRTLVETDKVIAGRPEWSAPDGVDHKIKVVAPLALRGRVFQGLELIGRASLSLRNADASFTLVYLPSDNRRDAIQLARVDWRPKSPHENDDPRAPSHLFGLTMDGTHHHSFELNWSDSKGCPLKWLPIAEPIAPDYATMAKAIDGVGKLFRIGNAGTALKSPWPQDLFDS